VGFRYCAKEMATQRSVTGYVMNYPDGSVVLVAEGGERQLKDLLQDILDSHLGRFIRGSNALWQPGRDEFDGFCIRHFYR
jgi:acylphosphatase